jgi:hypothetical protein
MGRACVNRHSSESYSSGASQAASFMVGALLGDAEESSDIDHPQEVLGHGSQPEPSLSASRS